MDKFYRVTDDPDLQCLLVTQGQHLIKKSDGCTFFCQTHRCDADECAKAAANDLVWSNSFDGGRYVASVIRTRPYHGLLSMTREGKVVFQMEVGIAYDAPFGPDMEDVVDWEGMCTKAADEDYQRRGEIPPI